MERISHRNPDLEKIREQGYAWVIRSNITGDYGAIFAHEEYVEESPGIRAGTSELLIVDFSNRI